MDTNKSAYWIALGVLALGLNSEYQHGRFVTLHRVADHAGSTLCRLSTRAEQTLVFARVLTSRKGLGEDNLLASADRAEIARDQAELRQEEARDRAERIRDRVRDTVRDQVRAEMRAEADVLRTQAEIRRAEIEQIRFRTHDQFRLATADNRRVSVVCPKTGARILVSAVPGVADASPEVEVDDSF